MATLSSSRQKALLRKYSGNIKLLMMLVSICFIVLVLPKQAKFRYEYEKGKVWNQKDLLSPYIFAIQKTDQEKKDDRDEAMRSIVPIYQLDADMEQQSLEGYKNGFEVKWKTSGLAADLKQKYYTLGYNLLKEVYDKGLLALNKKYQTGSENYRITILHNNIATETNTSQLYTPETALSYIDQALSAYKNIDKTFLIGIVQDRLQYNLTFDDKLTSRLENEAIEGLSSTRGMVQKGDLIVSKGSVINQDIYQKLESFKSAFEDNVRVNGDPRLVLMGQFLLVAIVISLLMVFLYLFRKDIYYDNRLVSLILLVITAMLATLSLAIRLQLPNFYYIPYCIVPIIIRILFDTRLALKYHLDGFDVFKGNVAVF